MLTSAATLARRCAVPCTFTLKGNLTLPDRGSGNTVVSGSAIQPDGSTMWTVAFSDARGGIVGPAVFKDRFYPATFPRASSSCGSWCLGRGISAPRLSRYSRHVVATSARSWSVSASPERSMSSA